MPRLGPEKQERFATYIANGYTQIAAYKEAGYTCKNTTAAANASKLASTPEVRARIEELQMKTSDMAALSTAPPLPLRHDDPDQVIDLTWINREYVSLLNKAKINDDIKNAAAILRDMAELNKVRPLQKSDENNNRTPLHAQLPHMGTQVAISVFNQDSDRNGRSSDGFVAISIPDEEFVPISYSEPDEDEST